MRHGTTARIIDAGINISQARLKTIGIYHDSISWGVWLHPGDKDGLRLPDLLISALNPASWPYTFRLTLRLRNEIGSMAAAAEFLQRKEVNILSARSSVSGHHHATWNVIGEALPVRQIFQQKNLDFLSYSEKNTREAVQIVRELLGFLDNLIKSIRNKDFLHPRFRHHELMSFSRDRLKDIWTDKGLWERIGDQRSKAVKCSVLPVLAYLWREGITDLRNGSKRLRPLEFEYSRETELLSCRSRRFLGDLDQLEVEAPAVSIASFDTDEHFLRLRFFREEERRRIYHLDIDYRQEFQEEKTTRGLIGFITRHIADRGINLIQVSNSVSDQELDREYGGIRFIGELTEEPKAEGRDLIELKAEIEQKLERRYGGMKAEVRIPPVSLGRMFLSRHQDLERNDALELIRETARSVGLETVEAQTVTKNVTENAVRELRLCNGLVQVFGKRKQRGKEDNQWMIGEYAAAIALGLPAIRIVDLSARTELKWRDYLRLDQDRPLIPYHGSWDKKEIWQELQKPLEAFFQQVRNALALPRAAG